MELKNALFVYVMTVLSIIIGAIIWLFEHRINDEFPKSFGKGIWAGFWYTFVTLTTVGYGDKVVKHFVSRIFALVWAIIGIMLTAVITATVMEEIYVPVELQNENIAVLESSGEMTLAKIRAHGIAKEYKNYESIIQVVRFESKQLLSNPMLLQI